MKSVIFICLIVGCFNLSAQTSAGETATVDSITLTWSVGELAVVNFSNGTTALTQGVIQPYEVSFANPGSRPAKDLAALEIALSDDSAFMVYPNPTSGFIEVLIPDEIDGNVVTRVFDFSGKSVLVLNEQSINGKLKLDLSLLTSGVYTLWIESRPESYPFKIIKN